MRKITLTSLVVGLLTQVYGNWAMQNDGVRYMSSPKTDLWDKLAPLILVSWITAVSLMIGAFRIAGKKPVTSFKLWVGAIIFVSLASFLPTYPNPNPLPFAGIVLWAGIGIQIALLGFAFSSVSRNRPI